MSMILKALFLLIILYYAVRASRSLLRAVQHDGRRPIRGDAERDQPRANGWQNPRESKRPVGADVEDAKWVDL